MTGGRRPSVLSIVRGAPTGAARAIDPALDANAYAVADEVELTLVLKDRGVELGVDAGCPDPRVVRGLEIPVTQPATDLRALVASGVTVHAVNEDLRARGIDTDVLVPGIQPITEAELAMRILASDVTLTTSS